MTRTISNSFAGILQELELERPLLLTSEHLSDLKRKYHIASSVEVIAARLKEKGWLISTDRQGVWEFVPAEAAGAYSTNDPLLSFRAFHAKYPTVKCALTFQTAAWVYGDSDRMPSTVHVAVEEYKHARPLKGHAAVSVFQPKLTTQLISNVPILARESIVVQMSARPSSVSIWESVAEWLPNFCAELYFNKVSEELLDRPLFVSQRLGYLIQGIRPDIADELQKRIKPINNAWFGDRKHSLRYDKRFMVADSLLPFDPKELGGNK
ncbi:MAG: type IV toxin-antitoxin system AbiEi family antitoxin [Clostridiales bacterium]|nr:type IV toxin-antitoxin system AbiEi family antitoxin [Clostridiales bacterium]